MNEIRVDIENIISEIDEEILEYKGENLIEEGLIDSFTIVTILALIEDKYKIEIKPEDVKEKNFRTLNDIVKLVIRYKENKIN